MSDENRTTPSDTTEAAERGEASAPHQPDRMPTEEEEAAAPTDVPPGVAEHYEEMSELGAEVKGEGQVE